MSRHLSHSLTTHAPAVCFPTVRAQFSASRAIHRGARSPASESALSVPSASHEVLISEGVAASQAAWSRLWEGRVCHTESHREMPKNKRH